jgi:hypothetical protein
MDGYVALFANRGMQRIVFSLLLLIVWALPCSALVSTNVPLDHWSYDAVEKLANYDLIDGAMLTTKPITRIEMARHIAQAMYRLKQEDNPPSVLLAIMERLKKEFEGELILIGVLDGWYGDSAIKPLEDPYVRYLYAKRRPELENMRGDIFHWGSDYRAGFASRGTLFDRAAFYLHPEYANPGDEDDGDIDLIEGYGKVMAGPFEIEVGKDSLWWGPGHHGSILMSNNAAPFTMVKITNPQPVQLPWVFRRVGPFRAEWFLADLGDNSTVPDTKLTGIRLNVRPSHLLELGFSRVIMFGGQGAPSVDAFDYAKMFFALSNQEENNQLAGADASLLIPLVKSRLLRSVRFYGDGAGEDESGGLPSKWSYLLGVQMNDILRTGRTDLRLEYADMHEVAYIHNFYTSGYTYDRRFIGHHAGTDSRDLFVQLSHYLTDDLLVDLSFDRQMYTLSGGAHEAMNAFEGNVTFFASSDWRLKAGYRYENGDREDDNHIFQFLLIRQF